MSQADVPFSELTRPYVNQWGAFRLTRDKINETAIRYFCEVSEDGNPVYWDEAFARQTRFGRLIAPPQAMLSFVFPPFWTPDHVADRTEQDALRFNDGPVEEPSNRIWPLLEEHGFPTSTVVTSVAEFLDAFGPGDGRIKTRRQVAAVSDVKQTRVGRGVFVTSVTELRTEADDRVIGRDTMVTLRYDPSHPREGAARGEGGDPADTTLGTRGEPRSRKPLETLRWQDIEVGEPLTWYEFPVTLRKLVIDASGTRDLYPIHHDRDFARAQGQRAPFVNTMMYQGMFGRLVTDWAGPEAFLRKLRFDMRQPNFEGDVMRSRAEVVRKFEENGQRLLDVEAHFDNQSERSATIGHLTVELP